MPTRRPSRRSDPIGYTEATAAADKPRIKRILRGSLGCRRRDVERGVGATSPETWGGQRGWRSLKWEAAFKEDVLAVGSIMHGGQFFLFLYKGMGLHFCNLLASFFPLFWEDPNFIVIITPYMSNNALLTLLKSANCNSLNFKM